MLRRCKLTRTVCTAFSFSWNSFAASWTSFFFDISVHLLSVATLFSHAPNLRGNRERAIENLSAFNPNVHLNPVRARLLPPEAALESFAWSSYGEYLKPAGQRPGWLRVDRLLGEKGIPKDSEAGRREFGLQMERRRAEESGANYEAIRGDWMVGSEAFRQELLAAAVERVGPSHYGAERQETGLQKAERVVQEELERLGWEEAELRARRKGHRAKGLLARRLREEKTMSLKWIAQRLHMGSWTYVSNLLNEHPAMQPQAQEVLPLCQK